MVSGFTPSNSPVPPRSMIRIQIRMRTTGYRTCCLMKVHRHSIPKRLQRSPKRQPSTLLLHRIQSTSSASTSALPPPPGTCTCVAESCSPSCADYPVDDTLSRCLEHRTCHGRPFILQDMKILLSLVGLMSLAICLLYSSH